MMCFIRDAIASSQSKGCALFVQVGTKAFVWRPLWAIHRDVAYVHVEIDTPLERLRIGIYGRKIPNSRRHKKIVLNLQPNQKPGNSYRDRWLKKLGYI